MKDPRLDTNVCAYLAAGAWHHHLITGDVEFLGELWPTIEGGIDFILRFQQPDGSVLWSLDSAGRPEAYALLTGSSSIYHSLRCAVAIAECLAKDRPDWELAAGRLGHAVAHHPGAFAPKVEFAMDWYYPVLSGALEGDAARQRMAESWSTFVMEGLGVRCVSTGDWVTAAETAECVLTLNALGMDGPALDLFAAGQGLRLPDGSYWTGMVYPEQETFPKHERTTYTFAAMVLAADALSNTTPAAGLFRGEGLPAPLDLAEPHCGDATEGCTAFGPAAALGRRGHPAQDPQAPALAVVDELSRVERGDVELVGRAPTVGGVGEHVMDGQPPAHGDVRGPPAEVGPGRLIPVAAVNETERERAVPARGERGGVADDAHHRAFEPGRGDGAAPLRQGVDAADRGVDEVGLVVVPPGLVLLRTAVVVDRQHESTGGLGRRTEIYRRLPAPRTDLDEGRRERARHRRPPGAERGLEEGLTLVVGHEPTRLARGSRRRASVRSLRPAPSCGGAAAIRLPACRRRAARRRACRARVRRRRH